MIRPATQSNLIFWEIVVAFSIIIASATLQAFHFLNNQWLVQYDEKFEYQVSI